MRSKKIGFLKTTGSLSFSETLERRRGLGLHEKSDSFLVLCCDFYKRGIACLCECEGTTFSSPRISCRSLSSVLGEFAFPCSHFSSAVRYIECVPGRDCAGKCEFFFFTNGDPFSRETFSIKIARRHVGWCRSVMKR